MRFVRRSVYVLVAALTVVSLGAGAASAAETGTVTSAGTEVTEW